MIAVSKIMAISMLATLYNVARWLGHIDWANVFGAGLSIWAFTLATRSQVRDTRVRDLAAALDAKGRLIEENSRLLDAQGVRLSDTEEQAARLQFELLQIADEILRDRGIITGDTRKGEMLVGAGVAEARLNILLVEDHKSARDALTRILHHHGYQVTQAGTLADAVAAVRARSRPGDEFDTIILDLGLPDGSGLALLDDVPDGTAVVISSGIMDADTEHQAKGRGVVAYLAKPYTMASLLAAMGLSSLKPPPNGEPSP